MKQQEYVEYCDTFLEIGNFRDYCPNGLQVEGDNRFVQKIITGVSLSEELIDRALEKSADMILTHHGLLWNNDDRVVKGPFKRKLQKLLDSGICAAAYHLPLDFHPTIGNNIQLAHQLGLKEPEGFMVNPKYTEGVIGGLPGQTIEEFTQVILEQLGRPPMVLPFGPSTIEKVAIVTGGAQGYFEKAIQAGADCFITGEISEKNYGMSQEYGVHFISAGHYATEKGGIQALGQHLAETFGVEANFIEFPNPV